ncbi:MAG: CDP-alcohol phosphatidyltransferase family protein [Promethearchaeota archaeon]
MNSAEEIYDKRKKQRELISKIIDKPVNFLIKHDFTPNILSFLGFVNILISTLFISLGFIHFRLWVSWFVPFFLLLGGIFDVFDGEVARRTGKESNAGAFLDSNIDRISDFIIILGLILGGLLHLLLAFIIIFLIIMISYTRAKAENQNIKMEGIGFLERAERLIFLTLALITESWIYNLTRIFLQAPITIFFPIFMIIFTILLLFTLGQRIYFCITKLIHS